MSTHRHQQPRPQHHASITPHMVTSRQVMKQLSKENPRRRANSLPPSFNGRGKLAAVFPGSNNINSEPEPDLSAETDQNHFDHHEDHHNYDEREEFPPTPPHPYPHRQPSTQRFLEVPSSARINSRYVYRRDHHNSEEDHHHADNRHTHKPMMPPSQLQPTLLEQPEDEEAEADDVPHHPLEPRRSSSGRINNIGRDGGPTHRNFPVHGQIFDDLPHQQQPTLEVKSIPSDSNNLSCCMNGKGGCGKKVSYALGEEEEPIMHQRQQDHMNMTILEQHHRHPTQHSPIPCQIRTESVESDMSFGSSTKLKPHSNRQPFQLNPPHPPPQLLVSASESESQSNFLCPPLPPHPNDPIAYQLLNNPNNNRVASNNSLHNQFSQDSLLSGGGGGAGSGGGGVPLHNNFSKDVLPLPIEIPESVADIAAFHRYLSVRRGAIRKNPQQFHFGDQTSPSYDSLGGGAGGGGSSRRAGRRASSSSTMGLAHPSGRAHHHYPYNPQLGHDVSRRTASLSHAIMTLALLSASICQLRFLVTYSHAHSYPVLNYFLIFTSIILEVFMFFLILSQIAAGIGYVMIARCNYDEERTESIHNYLIFALFIVAVANVILAAFAFDGHVCEFDMKNKIGSNVERSHQAASSPQIAIGSSPNGQFVQQQDQQLIQSMKTSDNNVMGYGSGANDDMNGDKRGNIRYNAIE